jgi:hypothetical protein
MARPGASAARRSQAAFAAALLDPSRPVPPGLRTWNGSDPTVRLAVHRNNVMVSLVGALTETFPVVRRLVGDAFFDAAARDYVRAHPPSSPVLTDYGDGFADWLAAFAPARALRYLADVARLERARIRAAHAADAASLPRAVIAAQRADPAALPAARLQLHPSCAVVTSRYAVATLWAAHQQPGDPVAVAIDEPECALVLRDPADDVLVVIVPRATAVLCAALIAGHALGDAVDAAAAASLTRPDAATDDPPDGFDPAAAFALLIGHGAIVAWHAHGDRP